MRLNGVFLQSRFQTQCSSTVCFCSPYSRYFSSLQLLLQSSNCASLWLLILLNLDTCLQPANVDQAQHLSTPVYIYQPLSIFINPYLLLSTPLDFYQPHLLFINPQQNISTLINSYQVLSTLHNKYQLLSTNINSW